MRKTMLFLASLLLVGALGLSAEQFADVQTKTLANGLVVAVKEVHEAPLASIQLTYRVGMKDAPDGRTEMPHFVEHMLFKGTPQFPRDKLALLVTENGGRLNGYTTWDRTTYVETVPSHQVQKILEMEASRMNGVLFDPAEVTTEKNVVLSEVRNYAGAQTNKFNRELNEKLGLKTARLFDFESRITEIQALTADEAKEFYSTYYRPDNAILVVVGDVDAKSVFAWAEEYFGTIAKPARPLLKTVMPFRPITEGAQVMGSGTINELIGYRYFNFIPYKPQSREYVLLFFITASNLVPELTFSAFPEGGYLVQVFNKRSPSPLEVLDWTSLEQSFPSAKSEVLERRELGAEAIEAIAGTITESICDKNDPRYEDWLTAQFATVDFSEIRAFLEKHLALEKPNVVAEFRPTATNDRSTNLDATRLTDSYTTVQDLSFLDEGSGAGETYYSELADRAHDTLYPRFKSLFDGIRTLRLENGLTVYIRQSALSSRTWATLLIPAGSLREKEPFTAAHTAKMVFTGGPQIKLKRELKKRGVSFPDAGVGDDYVIENASGPGKELAGILNAFALALGNRQFNPNILSAEIERNIANHKNPSKDINWHLNKNMQILFKQAGLTTYNPDDASDSRRERLSLAEIQDFYGANYRPDGSILVITSPETVDTVAALVQENLGIWKNPNVLPWEARKQGTMRKLPDEARRFTAIDQTRENVVFLFQSASGKGDPAERDAQLGIGGVILGDGFTGRMFRNLRVKQGLTYSANAWVQEVAPGQRIFGGFLLASPANLEAALAGWKGEVANIQNTGPTRVEYAFAKNRILNSYAFRFSDTESIHEYLVGALTFGKPIDHALTDFEATWKANYTGFTKVWKETIAPDRMLITIAGPGSPTAQ